MKKIHLLFTSFLMALGLVSSVEAADMTKRPEALPEKELKFPDYETKTLSNGLKIFVLKDDEQPTVSFSLLIKGGTSVEQRQDAADFLTSLLTKGAGSRDALQIAKELDGMGASLSASAGNDFITVSGFTLTKHMDKVFSIFGDVVTKPAFPSDELDKLKPQALQGLKYSKSQPATLANNLVRKVVFGNSHPYAQMQTEKSIEEISTDDIKAYYDTYFKPNMATLVVVGDVQAKEIFAKMETLFKDWKKGNTTVLDPQAPNSLPPGIYFIPRPGSVQSTIKYVTKTVNRNDRDYEMMNLASGVMGSGFAGRLFKTLRETHSYTYSPQAGQTSGKFYNRFVATADVRTDVTDSAMIVLRDQMAKLASENAGEDELNLIKKFNIGQFKMNFEDADFIGSLIQMHDFYGIPFDFVKKYPTRFMGYSASQVRQAALTYMNPQKAYWIVVGDPSVKPKLEKLGTVYEYDADMNPAIGAEKVDMSADELIAAYKKAIGGDAVDKVNNMVITATATMEAQGQSLPGKYEEYKKAGRKSYQVLDFGVFKQEIIVNGDRAVIIGQGGKVTPEAQDLEKLLFDAEMVDILSLRKSNYKTDVIGKKDGLIAMRTLSPLGVERTFYFNDKTFLLEKMETTDITPEGPVSTVKKYSDYTRVGDIMLPGTLVMNSSFYNMKLVVKYDLASAVDDAKFNTERQ